MIKKITILFVIIIIVGSFIARSTGALFSDTATVPNNTIKTGEFISPTPERAENQIVITPSPSLPDEITPTPSIDESPTSAPIITMSDTPTP